MADAGRLLELFQALTPDKATQQRILVDNPGSTASRTESLKQP
jgi:hypothetical protein